MTDPLRDDEFLGTERRGLSRCLAAVPGVPAQRRPFELVELQVTAGADVAWAAALLRCGMPEELDREPDRRLRLTFGLRKVDGRWLVGHEHHSFTIE